jgi:molybdopterin-biosynthesis enzyme MoeA-like protein
MAWPMVEWVLDTYYKAMFHEVAESEASIIVYDLPESTITPLMTDAESRYSRLKTFSLPSMGEAGIRRHIELGARGNPDEVARALEDMKAGVEKLGGRWEARLAQS